MKMKRWSCIAAILMLLLSLPVQAHAENETQTVILPVEIDVKGENPLTKERFTVELKAISEAAPLPSGGEAGIFRGSRTGAGSLNLEIPFAEKGVYSYKLKQIKGNNRFYTYDTAEYTVTVYVTADGTTTVLEGSGAGKRDAARFANAYNAGLTRPTPPRTGDDANPALWLTLMACAAVGCCTILLFRKKWWD